ncbi:MAG: peptidoglycan-binding protein [Lachnospiraceae bacterium]|nr:peptidoglycan-binding protein [Lachnospiraceae bacterium]
MANGSNKGVTLADVRSGKKSFVIDGTTTSPDIKALQIALQNFGFYIHAHEPTGTYLGGTAAAVRGFQNCVMNMSGPTGVVDKTTFQRLESYIGMTIMIDSTSVTPPIVNVRNGLNYFQSGNTGATIKTIRTTLKNKGYSITESNSFDATMVSVVKQFQKDNELTDNGLVNQATLAVLEDTVSDTGWVSGTTVRLTAGKLARCGFKKIFLRPGFVGELNAYLAKNGITTKPQIRHFLAQSKVEAWNGDMLTEKDYFPGEYGSASYKPYYGAGCIQVTGKTNYTAYQAYLKSNSGITDPRVTEPATYATQYVAYRYPVQASAWYWTHQARLGKTCFDCVNSGGSDNEAIVKEIYGIINPGGSGYKPRWDAYKDIAKVLK